MAPRPRCANCGVVISAEWIGVVVSHRPADKKDDPLYHCSSRCRAIIRMREWREKQKDLGK